MRYLFLCMLPLALCSGCGSDSEKNDRAESAPIPLALPSPAPAEKTSAAEPVQAEQSEGYSPAIRALLLRARTAVTEGRHAGAIEALSQAIGFTPEDARLFRMRADVYSLLGENANARADFSTAIRLADNNADLYNARGYFLMTQGIPAEARTDFDSAIERNPRHPAALNNRGLLHLAAGQLEESISDFSLAIEAQADFMEAWNNRSYARLKLEQLDDAMSDVRQAIRIRDDYPTAWNNCGLIAMEQQNYAEAARAFTRAIELSPLEIRLLQHRREAYLRLEQFREAHADRDRINWLQQLQQFTELTSRSRTSPDAWISRGEHLFLGREFGAAVQDFTRAILLQPKNQQALTLRAQAWQAMGDREKAMLDCNQALSSGDYQPASSLRGDLYLAADQPEQALADYEAAGRFDESVAEAHDLLAKTQLTAGDTAAAADSRRQAADIREALTRSLSPPENPPAADDAGFAPLRE